MTSKSIHINTVIGGDGITAASFTNYMEYIINDLGYKHINLRVNSNGGSVYEGVGMYSYIKEKIREGVEINGYNEGHAHSMASMLLQACSNRYAYPYSLMMVHNPFMVGGQKSDKDKQAVEALIDQSVSIYMSRYNGSEQDLRKMLEAETWLKAEEAHAIGLYDEILTADAKLAAWVDIAEVENLDKAYKAMQEGFTLLGQPIAKHHTKINNEMTDFSKIAAMLGLNSEASQETIENSLKELVAANEELVTENKNLKADLQIANDKLAEIKDEEAVAAVDAALEAGKIAAEDDDAKQELYGVAKADLDSFNKLVAVVPEPSKPKSGTLLDEVKKIEAAEGSVEDKDYDWWQKKHPDKLYEMSKSDPERFEKLYNDYYGATPTV